MQAFGLHAHEEEGAGHESHEEDNGFVWKALVVLVTIYGFFLFETLMHLCLKSKIGEHSHSHVDVEVGKFNTLDTACAKYFAYSSVIYFNGKMRSVLALLSLFFVLSLKSRVFCYPGMIILPENFPTLKLSVIIIFLQLPGPSSRHMSFKKERKCSRLERREGIPPIADNHEEKPPMGNGDIVLTNVVSRILKALFTLLVGERPGVLYSTLVNK